MNLQFKWLQEFLDIHLPEAGIIRGSDHQAQHIFYLPETPQTCPILAEGFYTDQIVPCALCSPEMILDCK